MSTLESLGAEQTRKTYARHGYSPNMFGVSFANLDKLAKRIKRDHPLALALWKTGNEDARQLALKIADPAQLKPAELDALVKSAGHRCLLEMFCRDLVARTPHAVRCMNKWMPSRDTGVSEAGWTLVAVLSRSEPALDDAFFLSRLGEIEEKIHSSRNMVRHAMNSALIAIGLRSPQFEKLALAAAARIGKVTVDHGDTSCKTPDAAAYIRKSAVRRSR